MASAEAGGFWANRIDPASISDINKNTFRNIIKGYKLSDEAEITSKLFDKNAVLNSFF